MKKVIFLAHFLLAIAGTMCGQTIVSGEYFFDKDPGQGKGAGFPVQSADSIENQISIPTTGLSEGIHHLGIRFQNVSGVWSQTQARMFLSRKFAPAQTEIVAAEYFFDKDPGIGKSTALTLPVHGDSLYIKTILTNPFDTGAHTLYIRTRNASGEWSLFEGYPFNICSGYGAESEFFYQVEGRKVIFDNQSIFVEKFEWDFGDGIKDTIAVNPTRSFNTGYHTVCLNTKNFCGETKLCKQLLVNGLQFVSPNYHANNGIVDIQLKGIGFEPGCGVKMKKGQTTILPKELLLISEKEILSTWVFDNTEIGDYDVILVYPSGHEDTLLSSFRIEKTQIHQTEIGFDLIGSENIRVNQSVLYKIALYNNNNESAYCVPVSIDILSDEIDNFQVMYLENFFTDSSSVDIKDSLLNNHFITLFDSIERKYSASSAIIVRSVNPGEPTYINFAFLPKNKESVFNIIINVGKPYARASDLKSFYAPKNELEKNSNFGSLCDNECFKCIRSALAFTPAACIGSAIDAVCFIDKLFKQKEQKAADILFTFAGYASDCIIVPGGFLKQLAVAWKTIRRIRNRPTISSAATLLLVDEIGDAYSIVADCANCFEDILRAIYAYNSKDPNLKTGISNFDSENSIDGSDYLHYAIYFENSDSAAIPAAQVIITDQLDSSKFDPKTFKFIGFGYTDKTFEYNSIGDSLIYDIDFRPNKNIILRHTAYFNIESMLIEWKFVSLDTLNYALTNDIFHGFLPPNITPPEGEGFVLFSIKPKPDLPHGTVIKNKADIIFDFNDPITTPEWINTIDKVKPESHIEILPDTLYSDTVTLRIHGSDDGSGVQSYDIFLSVNDSAYTPYYQGLTADSLRFAGNYNNTYRFFSRARDFVGNLEDTTHTADAQTRLLVSAGWINESDGRVHFSPNPVRYTLYADINLPGGNVCMARLYNIFGHAVLRKDLPNRAISALDVSGLPEGLYFIEISRQGELRGLSKVIVIIK